LVIIIFGMGSVSLPQVQLKVGLGSKFSYF